ncbi:PREDICTED: uncharacterized protein LOC109592183 [Amphimedon queenslandica]|uniref:Death domain-containing protein n=1 Tax=Amphimedon queenslandica TaxID=400682 RepID=A0A1X7VN36_AMPQE|nr:PREDICTED: uncharacterized protein LOC109592183 [Amphimedon queenslandica]|eukprot:XP_019863270.1 PREDICTED: uncharacterized protein LOC109592183 [Amphimedon queenslandica]
MASGGREDAKVAYKVFSCNISRIKETANVDLTRLADKLKAKKIISQGDRDKAVDGYTKQTEAQRRGELIDRVQENLKCDIGEAFEIFLGILREEDTRQLSKLVADLERGYDEIVGGPGGEIKVKETAKTDSKVSSKAKPQNNELTIRDLGEVISALQKHHFTTTKWGTLCLHLGILYDKLKNIEDNHPKKVEQQFQEGISQWLRLQYEYEKYGKPTWRILVNTLEKINERAVAEGIRKDKLS